MGWASAGSIFDRVAQGLIDGKVATEIAKPVLVDLIGALKEMDWDTTDESRDEFLTNPMVEDAFFEADGDPFVCKKFTPSSYTRGKGCEGCGWSRRMHKLHPEGLGDAE